MVILGLVIVALDSILAVGLAYTAAWINAFGPGILADGWTGVVVQLGLFLVAILIILSGSMHQAGSVMDDFRHRTRPGFMRRLVTRIGTALAIVAWMVGFFAPFIAMWTADDAVDAMVFEQRGKTTMCTVLRIHKRVETTTDSDDNRTTWTYYDHDLACTVAAVRKMTTSDKPAAQPPQRLVVRYDPLGHLDPRPADSASSSGDLVLTSLIALAVAVVTRFLLALYAYVKRSVEYLAWYSMMGPLVLFGLVQLSLMAGTFWATDSVLALFGISRQGLHGWRSWLVGTSFLVVTAAVLTVSVKLAVKALTRLLHRDSIVRSWLEEFETSFQFQLSVGGGVVAFDSGVLEAVGKRIVRLFRRRSRRASMVGTAKASDSDRRGGPAR